MISTRDLAPPLVYVLCIYMGLAQLGCAATRPLLASPGDYVDYRTYRMTQDRGMRLRRAQAYLAAHPGGSWAAEVSRDFEEDEPRYYEACQASRAGTSEYLANLPAGPHAQAAIALLTAFDTKIEELDTEAEVREARRTEATLEKANIARKQVGAAILGALGVLLDPGVYGRSLADAPEPLRRRFAPVSTTWGGPPRAIEEDLFFLLPTRPERTSRLLTLSTEVVVVDGVVRGARLSGPDLFVTWYEAANIALLDPTDDADRRKAQAHAVEILDGALEASFPRKSCGARLLEGQILARACDGRTVAVTAGARAGEVDRVEIAEGVK